METYLPGSQVYRRMRGMSSGEVDGTKKRRWIRGQTRLLMKGNGFADEVGEKEDLVSSLSERR
jgi:hypothetical protein